MCNTIMWNILMDINSNMILMSINNSNMCDNIVIVIQ